MDWERELEQICFEQANKVKMAWITWAFADSEVKIRFKKKWLIGVTG